MYIHVDMGMYIHEVVLFKCDTFLHIYIYVYVYKHIYIYVCKYMYGVTLSSMIFSHI